MPRTGRPRLSRTTDAPSWRTPRERFRLGQRRDDHDYEHINSFFFLSHPEGKHPFRSGHGTEEKWRRARTPPLQWLSVPLTKGWRDVFPLTKIVRLSPSYKGKRLFFSFFFFGLKFLSCLHHHRIFRYHRRLTRTKMYLSGHYTGQSEIIAPGLRLLSLIYE